MVAIERADVAFTGSERIDDWLWLGRSGECRQYGGFAVMKVREAGGLDGKRQSNGCRKMRSQTGWLGSFLARTTCAHGAGVACALWVSTGWAQQPPPADEPPTAEAPAAAEPPAEATPPAADAPAADAPAADAPATDMPSMDLEVGDAEPGQPGANAPGAGGMDEVVITVDRRRKNLQDYSGTAAAFSESQLSNLGVSNVTNLTQVVPGLQISVNDQGSSSVYIRGVGSDNTTELGDPAVAIHLDNVLRFFG